ncbi:MAG TPA: hypothetical protein EYP17_01800 [Candidatus Latescibacteria bacterium]|nr:hypothetical protein [Candidatus Latescibacterota bacterium]
MEPELIADYRCVTGEGPLNLGTCGLDSIAEEVGVGYEFEVLGKRSGGVYGVHSKGGAGA